jgi:hypothetical protein
MRSVRKTIIPHSYITNTLQKVMKTNKEIKKEKLIQLYEEEAQAHLNLYISGKDDSAYQRYETLKNYVMTLRSQ